MRRIPTFFVLGLLGLALFVSAGVTQDTKKEEKKAKDIRPALTTPEQAENRRMWAQYNFLLVDIQRQVDRLDKQVSEIVLTGDMKTLADRVTELERLMRPQVADFKDLGLDAIQKAKIDEIRSDYMTKIAALNKQINELKKQEQQESFKVLTEDQRRKYLGSQGVDTKKKEPEKKGPEKK